MRYILIILSFFFFAAAASTEETSFEKSFQKFGKKLDGAKAKGEQLGTEAKKEWKDLKAKTEQTTDEIANKTEAKGKDWRTRAKGAYDEFSTGVKNAWNKLTGEP